VKLTPGNWIVDRRDSDAGRIYVAQQYGDGPGGRICEVFTNCLVRDEAREGNALLIAGALELLEVVRMLDRHGVASPMLMKMAARALAKIEGGQS
jgi:hypothetical protein